MDSYVKENSVFLDILYLTLMAVVYVLVRAAFMTPYARTHYTARYQSRLCVCVCVCVCECVLCLYT